MHVLGPAPAQYASQVTQAARRSLEELAHDIERRDALMLEPRLERGNTVDRLDEASAQFDLVVAGARGEHALLDLALGRTSDRLARRLRRALLVVKRPARAPYRRVLVAVDFAPASRAAALLARRLAPAAELRLAHGFEVEFESTLRLAGITEDKVNGYRREAREHAAAQMERFIADLGVAGQEMLSIIAHGYAPHVVLEQAAAFDAELIALGRTGRSKMEEWLLGSVALHVLELARCDVMLVPSA
jgi:CPA2 family monovalent cation:H+ antiporter-2